MGLRHIVRCMVQAAIGIVWLHAVVEQLDAHVHLGLKPKLQTLTTDREVQFSDASVVDHCLSLRRLEHATAELCAIAM
ncbi:hypothetical protein SPRG_14188 [Saprolegnia parasitica CBS 223.65]|uniref:Secreted protein n=1 Tax=Saprolegnia parasitica (strain CBS 223.65) TaxID=695850 RepID=A0A067BT80_SAPPC|nr:hypothetical protein SPRG_14188 [Saprolegnia parasitica CBS 223.65]KDO20040.1 hypothetical protein SPRG_14188 [Saprolegnia parasitica CBS 223.65]|eukprot:XP_012209274.1 hypothetical protein SPRG_14188 [Saprolegnia parasitica CBS 223.65]